MLVTSPLRVGIIFSYINLNEECKQFYIKRGKKIQADTDIQAERRTDLFFTPPVCSSMNMQFSEEAARQTDIRKIHQRQKYVDMCIGR